MLLLLLLLELIPGSLCTGLDTGQLFMQLEIYDTELTLSSTPYDSLLACSIKCAAAYPLCKAFVFANNKCRHGQPSFNQDKSGNLVTAFMAANEKSAVDFLAQMDAEKEARRQTNFEDHQWVFKDKLYWRSKTKMNFEQAKQECGSFGGILAVLYDKDVFDFFIENGVLSNKTHQGSKNGVFVGLQTNLDTTKGCVFAGCDNKLTWEDGTTFLYQPHLECTEANHPQEKKHFFIFLTTPSNWYGCKPEHGEIFNSDFWRLTDLFPDREKIFICEFKL